MLLLLPDCIEDKVQADYRALKITSRDGSETIFPHFAFCKKCKSYLIEDGKTKSPLEAARDLYAQNPFLGKPRDIVKATYMPRL